MLEYFRIARNASGAAADGNSHDAGGTILHHDPGSGPSVAFQHLAGTLLVGFCCYLVLCWEAVAHLIVAYPEAHCFTIALLVLIGRYTGYQLLEPWRFRDFADLKQA